jgi:hypothetical protein
MPAPELERVIIYPEMPDLLTRTPKIESFEIRFCSLIA